MKGMQHLILFRQDERLLGRDYARGFDSLVYPDPGGEGYLCIFHMARLAAELLNGKLIVVQPGAPALTDKLSGILLPRKDRVHFVY